MKTQKLNLSSYGVTKMNDSEMRNSVGGWWWIVVGLGLAALNTDWDKAYADFRAGVASTR